MGLTSSAFADPHARLTPELAPETEKLERGHGRGSTYVDRSRTDSLELRGFPCVGYGVAGVITGTRPGDSVAILERTSARWRCAQLADASNGLAEPSPSGLPKAPVA